MHFHLFIPHKIVYEDIQVIKLKSYINYGINTTVLILKMVYELTMS